MFPAEALPLWWCCRICALRAGVPVLVAATIGFALHGDIVMKPTMLLAIPLMVLQTLSWPASP